MRILDDVHIAVEWEDTNIDFFFSLKSMKYRIIIPVFPLFFFKLRKKALANIETSMYNMRRYISHWFVSIKLYEGQNHGKRKEKRNHTQNDHGSGV